MFMSGKSPPRRLARPLKPKRKNEETRPQEEKNEVRNELRPSFVNIAKAN